MNIVIVEDSPLIRKLIVCRLRSVAGAQVVGHADNETEAVAVIAREQPDVVLLDLQLSPGFGINVLKQMRAAGSTSKVLVFTHQPHDAYRRECEAFGIDGFHDKGTDLEDVIDRIEQWASEASPATHALPSPASDAPSSSLCNQL